jgi:hypothetical protein
MHTGFWWENTRKGNLEGNNRRWEDNIKMDLKEIGCESVYWIDVAQVRGNWWANVNTVIDLRVT